MANPTLNSFLSPNYFNNEITTNPLYAAMLAGSTFVTPSFSGICGAASTDPGGLFGWLMYSRIYVANPVKGTTSDTYIVYNNAFDFINDLNALSGITGFIISQVNSGGTYGLFTQSGTELTPQTIGNDFLYALHYLAYGAQLILAGSTTGFYNYETTTSNKLDILIGQTANTAVARYVEKTPQIIGIFPTASNGSGYTAQNFDSLFSSSNLVTGATVSDRIFNVNGQIQRNKIPTTTLSNNTTITYTLNAVSEVAGAFARAKNTRNIYVSVAGVNYSTPLNGIVKNPILWYDSDTKNIFKKNRVNFYSKTDANYFLGLDVVGATAGAGITYSSNERVGPSKLYQDIETQTTNILLKYVFSINNSATRSAVVSEVKQYLVSLSQYIDSNFTLITCDSSNNTDNSSTITVEIVVKPIVSTEEFVITVTSSTQ
jgi:hypothetical protein